LVNAADRSRDGAGEAGCLPLASAEPFSFLSFPAGSARGTLRLGMSPQDVISALQSPDVVSAVQYPAGRAGCTSSCAQWRYHYLGLELFFSATHRLFRVICRNNLAPHADFCLFHRSAFLLRPAAAPGGGASDASLSDADGAADGAKAMAPPAQTGSKKKKGAVTPPMPQTEASQAHREAAFYDRWEVFLARLQQWFNAGAEVVHASPAVQLAPECSPYLPTRLYAYPEVSLHNVFYVCCAGEIK
jgi:hypothetical protein